MIAKDIVLARAERHPMDLGEDFADWLRENWSVWERFEAIADQVYERQRRRGLEPHYSARTIGEVMRHETVISEASGDFKLNNNRFPKLARLYLLVKPERTGFFELRNPEERIAA